MKRYTGACTVCLHKQAVGLSHCDLKHVLCLKNGISIAIVRIIGWLFYSRLILPQWTANTQYMCNLLPIKYSGRHIFKFDHCSTSPYPSQKQCCYFTFETVNFCFLNNKHLYYTNLIVSKIDLLKKNKHLYCDFGVPVLLTLRWSISIFWLVKHQTYKLEWIHFTDQAYKYETCVTVFQ